MHRLKWWPAIARVSPSSSRKTTASRPSSSAYAGSGVPETRAGYSRNVNPQPNAALNSALAALDRVIFGKSEAVRLALACLLARGHLLIEDVPGVGKTTLAHGLARVLGLAWQRVQFTSDLLPADIIGVSVFDANSSGFSFKKGPIFTQLLLADEVNRASP